MDGRRLLHPLVCLHHKASLQCETSANCGFNLYGNAKATLAKKKRGQFLHSQLPPIVAWFLLRPATPLERVVLQKGQKVAAGRYTGINTQDLGTLQIPTRK